MWFERCLDFRARRRRGAAPAPEGAAGLARYEVLLPGAAALEKTRARVRAAGIEAVAAGDGWQVRDPSGNALLLRV